MGLLEDYFVPLHNFYLTPESFDQKVGRNSRLCFVCFVTTWYFPVIVSFLFVPSKYILIFRSYGKGILAVALGSLYHQELLVKLMGKFPIVKQESIICHIELMNI